MRARRAAYRGLIPAPLLAAESVDDRELRWRKRLSNPEGRCWLLGDGTGVFGFAYTAPPMDDDLERDSAELHALYLLEERIGAGHGRRLVRHALDDLRRRGYREVVVWYAEENDPAARFYAAAGFEPDPRIGRTPLGDTGLRRRRLRQAL